MGTGTIKNGERRDQEKHVFGTECLREIRQCTKPWRFNGE